MRRNCILHTSSIVFYVIVVKRMSLHRLLNKASLSSEGHGRAFWSELEEERLQRWAVDWLIMVKAG